MLIQFMYCNHETEKYDGLAFKLQQLDVNALLRGKTILM